MQLSRFIVNGLFGKYDHDIVFPTAMEPDPKPSVVILHGPNGIGKTTILRMLNGMMSLDFSTFREVPVKDAALHFNTGEVLLVEFEGEDRVIKVTFGDIAALLHPQHSGAWQDDDPSVENFRESFKSATQTLEFKFLSTKRESGEPEPDTRARLMKAQRQLVAATSREEQMKIRAYIERITANDNTSSIKDTLQRFIAAAQLDSPRFFQSREPDLFMRILDDLSGADRNPVDLDSVRAEFNRIRKLEEDQMSLGLSRDYWDYDRLMSQIDDHALTDERSLVVLRTYAEFLATRVDTRQLITDRLRTFERVMADFYLGKRVKVHAKHGMQILDDDNGTLLSETKLSTGEYQLLYLMVAALTTRRRGTIIAIDEPELSIHIAWQRRIVPSLLECASHATPQLILATHSPDIASNYMDSMVDLGVKYR